jgi:hypothetical protein
LRAISAHPDGRTILLDWGCPGRAAPLADLAWFLAVRCGHLPESKEHAIEAYRRSLEALLAGAGANAANRPVIARVAVDMD